MYYPHKCSIHITGIPHSRCIGPILHYMYLFSQNSVYMCILWWMIRMTVPGPTLDNVLLPYYKICILESPCVHCFLHYIHCIDYLNYRVNKCTSNGCLECLCSYRQPQYSLNSLNYIATSELISLALLYTYMQPHIHVLHIILVWGMWIRKTFFSWIMPHVLFL